MSPEMFVTALSLTGIYFLISFGITLMYGVGGFPNLAVGPIGLTGAYLTCSLIRMEINVAWAILMGLGGAILLGVLIQRFVVEPLFNTVGGGDRGRIFVIYGTFGLCLLFPAILQNVFKTTMMNMRLPSLGIYKVFHTAITGYQLLSIAIAMILFIVPHIVFTRTKGGTQVRSVTQNALLSRLMGINVRRIYLITAGLAGACAYIGAVLWGEIFSLELGSGTMFTLYGFIVAVMGGLGSIYGALLVSIILGLSTSVTSFLIGGVFEHIVTTIILIFVLIVAPRGLVPTRREV